MVESRIPWKGDGSPEHTRTDCRTPDGVTVSLIDGVIATCRVLRERNLTTPAVMAALSDLWQDEDVRAVAHPGMAVVLDSTRLKVGELRCRIDDALSWLDEPDDASPEVRLAKIDAALRGPR